MFVNSFIISLVYVNLVVITSATLQWEKQEQVYMGYHKYNFDENYQLLKMHSTPEAKLFLEGCREVYSSVNSSNITDLLENEKRTFSIENPNDSIILAIFSLDEFSILIYFKSPFENSTDPGYVNITLGINRNSNTSISGFGNVRQFGNDAFNDDDFMIPEMPYYIAISTLNGEVQVSQIRIAKYEPFLKYKYSTTQGLTAQSFRFDHLGAIYAHYGCCDINCKQQIFHRISGCNKYSTRVVSTQDKFDLQYYYNDLQQQKDKTFIFTGNFFIDRPITTFFGAKIRFYEFNDRPGDYYEIVLTDAYATIYQYAYSSNSTVNQTISLTFEVLNPITINITITKSGRVSLTRTLEAKPFLVYQSRRAYKSPVNVKFMSLSKLFDDSIRYDFYYNCSDVLTYFNETPVSPVTHIVQKFVRRLNESRYDLVQIFNDTYDIDQKFGKYYNEKLPDFDDIDIIDDDFKSLFNSTQKSETDRSETIQKAIAGASSFLFVAVLKYISTLETVKNFLGNKDEEKLKEHKTGIVKKFDGAITKYFGDDDE